MSKDRKDNLSPRIENRKAWHDYFIEAKIECGMVLVGSEVKSLRLGKAQIAQSYAGFDRDGLLKVFGMQIDEYKQSGAHLQHEPRRPRTLLLKQKELRKLTIALTRYGMTLVPLKLYFTQKGKAKLLLGLAKGKKTVDKRETIKKRDWEREKGREMRGKK